MQSSVSYLPRQWQHVAFALNGGESAQRDYLASLRLKVPKGIVVAARNYKQIDVRLNVEFAKVLLTVVKRAAVAATRTKVQDTTNNGKM